MLLEDEIFQKYIYNAFCFCLSQRFSQKNYLEIRLSTISVLFSVTFLKLVTWRQFYKMRQFVKKFVLHFWFVRITNYTLFLRINALTAFFQESQHRNTYIYIRSFTLTRAHAHTKWMEKKKRRKFFLNT